MHRAKGGRVSTQQEGSRPDLTSRCLGEALSLSQQQGEAVEVHENVAGGSTVRSVSLGDLSGCSVKICLDRTTVEEGGQGEGYKGASDKKCQGLLGEGSERGQQAGHRRDVQEWELKGLGDKLDID